MASDLTALETAETKIPAQKKKWSRVFQTALRFLISAAGLLLILSLADVSAAIQSMSRMNVVLFVGAFFVFQVGNIVRSVRWGILLENQGKPLPLRKLLEYNYIGAFFNLFLPTAFGGDAVRILEVRRNTDTVSSIATVFVDRLSGIVVLFVMALAIMPFTYSFGEPRLMTITTGTCALGLVAGALLLQNTLLDRILAQLARWHIPGMRSLRKINTAIHQMSRHRRTLAGAFGASFVFNALLILVYYLAALALHLNLPFYAIVMIVPIASVLAFVPSLQGLGVRESAIILLTAPFAVAAADALALGVLIYLVMLGTGGIGLITYILSGLER